ncbi:MAG: hypothetical protein A2170_05090 [Deltaproteobacteria bacterium RBG_13_53_10]|nr:MAG: hypothetical protein A2170_05090 [Deltaproteobacteria bacterium RBG_13_53_10]
MKKPFISKILVYFLCTSFLLMMSGFPGMIAHAKEKSIPIGDMVSKGEVAFEAREGVWKKAESSHLPLFRGTKMKIEKGNAMVTVSNGSQIKIGPNSLLSLEDSENLLLSKGHIEFRIPSGSDFTVKVGALSVVKSRALQATKGPSIAVKSEETIGSVSVHSKGAVTVKSTLGRLSILDKGRVVLAALSAKEAVTFPTMRAGEKSPVRVAQLGEASIGGGGGGGILGISVGAWVGILAGAGAIAGIGIAVDNANDDDDDQVPVCP